MKPNMEGFLLGVISTCSLVAGLFFLKYWRRTRDTLFLGFGVAFVIEAFNRLGFLALDEPNRGSWVIYFVRLIASLIILSAIVRKNFGSSSSKENL